MDFRIERRGVQMDDIGSNEVGFCGGVSEERKAITPSALLSRLSRRAGVPITNQQPDRVRDTFGGCRLTCSDVGSVEEPPIRVGSKESAVGSSADHRLVGVQDRRRSRNPRGWSARRPASTRLSTARYGAAERTLRETAHPAPPKVSQTQPHQSLSSPSGYALPPRLSSSPFLWRKSDDE
jgi:hypothetical protein